MSPDWEPKQVLRTVALWEWPLGDGQQIVTTYVRPQRCRFHKLWTVVMMHDGNEFRYVCRRCMAAGLGAVDHKGEEYELRFCELVYQPPMKRQRKNSQTSEQEDFP